MERQLSALSDPDHRPIFRMEIPMMSGRFTLPLGYSPEMECRILELPFTQKRISMFILLPDETAGLAALERKITAENVKMLFTTLEVIQLGSIE